MPLALPSHGKICKLLTLHWKGAKANLELGPRERNQQIEPSISGSEWRGASVSCAGTERINLQTASPPLPVSWLEEQQERMSGATIADLGEPGGRALTYQADIAPRSYKHLFLI